MVTTAMGVIGAIAIIWGGIDSMLKGRTSFIIAHRIGTR